MVVGFCSIKGWCYTGWWVCYLRTLAHFQRNGMKTQGQSRNSILWFCDWCEWRELGGRVSRRFPCVTSVMESFSDLWAIIIYWTESHLKSCPSSTMELSPFCKKSTTADVRLDSKCTSDWKSAVNVGVGRLQVHVICSCVLAHSEIVETWSNY